MKVQAKILLALSPFILAPLTALGWVAYTQQRDSVKAESLRQMETLMGQVARFMEARVETARANIALFSGSDVLRRYLLVEDEAQRFQLLQPSLLRLLQSYQDAYPEYYEVRVLLPDGYEDTRSTPTPIPNVTDEEGNTEYFRYITAAKEDLLVKIERNPDNGEPVLMVSQRLAWTDPSVDPILAKPRLRGYLVVTMSLDFLNIQTQEAVIGHGGHIVFTDAEGEVLFSPRRVAHGDTLASPSMRELGAIAESESILRAEHLGGMHLMRARRLYDNLYLFAAFPESELLASTSHLALVAAMLTVGTIVLTWGILYALLRTLLLTPLEKLAHAAREIGRGNLDIDLGIQRGDEIGALAASFQDMGNNLKSSHEQVSYLAYHDSLTGLPNRRMFTEFLENAVALARRHEQTLALLFVDVDDFKRVNDSLGHHVGDQLLREVADRFVSTVRSYDHVCRSEPENTGEVVARLGGDEFVILLPDLEKPLDAAVVARRLLDALITPIAIEGHELQVNSSIGITTYPEDSETVSGLIKNADIAMYHAKEQGKNHYQFYKESMNTALVERMSLESSLKNAIASGELLLFYQPQVDAVTGTIVGTEALLRWNNPELGMVSPGAFIPLAEETGLIVPIGEWVLHQACRQNKAWQEAGLPPVSVSVNISGRQFSRSQLEKTVTQAVSGTGLEPRYLDIEITETSLMEAPEDATRILTALKALGVRISMDDFGTGYSSLSSLKKLPIDCLKIDQSFVRDIVTDKDDATIVSTIIAMSTSLQLSVIAEGVEYVDQLKFLRERGCQLIQGYLFSKPVPAHEMAALLASGPFPVPGSAAPALGQTHGGQPAPLEIGV